MARFIFQSAAIAALALFFLVTPGEAAKSPKGTVAGSATADPTQSRDGRLTVNSDSVQLTPSGGVAPAAKNAGIFIVQMKDDPAAAYDGRKKKYAASKPGKGHKYDSNTVAARSYADALVASHNKLLKSASAGNSKLYSYAHSFNGFAAELSPAQVAQLAADPEVLRIWADEKRELHTNYSPEFLGLNESNGPWERGITGEGVIVGVIDSGIWPENPSFSDQEDLSLPNGAGKRRRGDAYGPAPSGWNGTCQSGEQFSQNNCNNKLIGVRYFPYGFGANLNARNGVTTQGYNSVRDDDDVGHGSHTSSTAAGNRNVTLTRAGTPVLEDALGSGVAPRARIAHYKACWNAAGCFTSDLVAAIDSAVADGVDVINYSIGSSSTNIFAGDDVAFLFAAAAGVHVATSNGNSGPGPGSVGSPAGDPWVLSVGASTREGTTTSQGFRVNAPPVVAGDSSALEGAITKPLSIAGEISAELKAADPLQACDPLANNLGGSIAFIERGTCAFTVKVTNAVNAGAAAVVLFTDDRPKTVMGGTATKATSSVPGLMIDRPIGLAILGQLETGEVVNATVSPAVFVASPSTGNIMAGFSSRGPNLGAIDVIKPDVTAPGVGILAATTPTPLPEGSAQNINQLFRYLSGTSMSSPHAAGALALIKQVHPGWSPAMAKSALMTTARQDVFKEDGSTPADPFDFGGGHIQPGMALDPGLVYDAGLFDYAAYICAVNPNFWAPGTCAFLAVRGLDVEDPTQLNYPSIGVSRMVGTKTVTRTVTNVADGEHTYVVSVEAPPGVDVEVSPSELTIPPGETASYDVIFSANKDLLAGEWVFGALTWSHGPHNVRSPIAIRGFGIAAPDEVSASGIEGSLTFDIEFGFSGDYSAGVHGLNPAFEIPGSVEDDPGNSYDFPSGSGIARVLWGYLPGTAFSRFELRDAFTDGDDDLDLYVWECDAITSSCSQVGVSTSFTSNERVDLLLPKTFNGFGVAGTFYVVDVHGWETDGPDASYTLFEWEFGLVDDAGNMTVMPSKVDATLGGMEALKVDWSGLDPDGKYLGAVSHTSPGGLEGLTLISIE